MIALAAGSRHSAAFCSQRRPTQYCSPTPHAAAQQHTGGASAAAAAAARAPLRLQCRLQAPCQRATAARSSAADTQGTPSSGGNDGIHLPASEGLTSAAATSLAIKELEEAAADVLGSAAAPAEGEAEVDTTEGLLQSKELREMLAFAVPALGMVLADPLMSLIDTACVGRVSSLQLAALGPNTAIFSFAFQLFAFLGVGTTNVIASNSLRAAGLDGATLQARREAAERTLCNSLVLSLACGGLVAGVLLTCGWSFLQGMGTAPELLMPAWHYLSIRALAAPAVLVMAVSQGACLGQQDAWTPFKVLVAAGLLNAVGDVCLVSHCGQGVAGAAAATAAAQYLGAAYSLWYLHRKGSLPGGIRLRWTGFPRVDQMREFLLVAGTLFTRTVFGMLAYLSMTTSATRLGTLATATHQVAMQTFWFCSYFPEPLSLAAQSLLARDRAHPARAAHWARLLLKSGAALGVLLAAAVGAIFCWGTWLFTPDVAVQLAVRQLAPVAMLAISVCSVMMMFDGISVGSGSFGHLPPSNIAGLAATLTALQVGRSAGWGLRAVWCALISFYATRLLGHLLRYWCTGGGVFAAGSQ